MKYPSKPSPAPSQLVVETYHGFQVEDHYRNLENLEDMEVQNWLKQQSNHTSNVLNKIPRRQYLIDKQLEFDKRKSHTITSLKVTKDDHYFYLKKVGGENYAKLYYRKDFSAKEELLYDPANYKPKSGFTYVINFVFPDWYGEKIVISLTKDGEEFSEMIIMDVATKSLLPDLITNCQTEHRDYVNWLPDNSGFFYSHHPVVDKRSMDCLKNTKSVYYKLGQNAHHINDIFSATNNPEFNIQPEDLPKTIFDHQDSKYLLIRIGGASRFQDNYYAKMVNPEEQKFDWKLLFSKADKVVARIIKENELVFISGKNAPNFKICKTSLDQPDFTHPIVLVPEKKEEVIQNMVITIDGLFYVTYKNGVEAKLYHLKDGIETEIVLPIKAGRIALESKGAKYPELWLTTMGWVNNKCRYQYTFSSNTFEEANLVPSVPFPEFEELIVKEVLVKSHDGEEVPLSIIHKKGLVMNGKHPVIIFGYGAYGNSSNPFFNPNFLLFTEEGGILAWAHVRGGGEKGIAWHNGGKKTTKPNSWKDLIACAEYMIHKQYTSKQGLAIWGSSAGGILVGRAMTERPDLFAVVITMMGVMNPVRSENAPNGANGVKEFGTVENPEEFKARFEMDAYLHIEKGEAYPATLVTAGINDVRTVVWQPAKFAAKLQAYQQSDKPILFLVDYKGGHGKGNVGRKKLEIFANTFAFTLWQTGHSAYQLE